MSTPVSALGLIRLGQVGSTNDEVRARIERGEARDLMAITALSQTQGRGRRGRSWVSPPGNLHLSIALRPGRPTREAAQIGFVAALALVEALDSLLPGVSFRCKWPNDVVCPVPPGLAKVAGMLLETVGDDWLVLGIGVDVAQAPPPGETLHAAVSLASLGWTGGIEPVLAAFAERFVVWLESWRAGGLAAVRSAWLSHAYGLGEPMVVRLESETLTGGFAALDPDGALVLDQGASGQRRIHAGDVFFPGA